MTNVVKTDDTQQGPSPSLWQGNEPDNGQWSNDRNKGWADLQEFLRLPVTGHEITIEQADDKASVAQLAEEGGGLNLVITGDDNEQCGVGYGAATTAPLVIGPGTGEGYFEARVKPSSVTDDVLGMFVGLAQAGSLAADFIADDGLDIADKSVVGFFVKSDDGDAADTIFQTAGSAFTTVQAGAATLVAATWVKLGIHWLNGKVTFWVNGEKAATAVLSSATGFPDAVLLNPILSVKVSSDAALSVALKWWGFAQEAVTN